MKLRVWAVPAVAALLLLTGCDQLSPGTASMVNGTRITEDEVAAVADAQCVAADEAAKAGGATATAMSRVHQQSLFLLIDAEISKQYAEEEGLEPSKGLAEAFFSEFEKSLAELPEKPRTVLEGLFKDWADSRAVLVQAGSEATGQPPSQENVEQLLNAGLQARAEWMQTRRHRHRPALRTRRGRPPRRRRQLGLAARVRLREGRRRGGGRPRVGRRASGQPEVRLRSWRAHRRQPSPRRPTCPRRPSCPR